MSHQTHENTSKKRILYNSIFSVVFWPERPLFRGELIADFTIQKRFSIGTYVNLLHMEISQLESLSAAAPDQGLSISQCERIKISCSLKLLQNQMKAESMFFLGKVLGVSNDYYIAFSAEPDQFIPAVFYCSQDCVNWFSLASVDDEGRAEILPLKTPLTGTLTSETTLPSGRIVSEEQRLAAFVSDLAANCLLIPRGVTVATALGQILKNPMWVGIEQNEFRKLKNIKHWRRPEKKLTALEKSFTNPALDFMDPLEDLSTWTYDFGGENDEIKMRSLRWPGFEFYIRRERFANLYFGNGLAEVDVTDIISTTVDHSQAHKNIK